MSEVLTTKRGKTWAFPRPASNLKIVDRAICGDHNFRMFVLSEFVVLFGFHFYAIALPWLVIEMTGSVEAMGLAIVLSGVPRLAFVMVGGLLVDRHSPRVMIMLANIIRAIILALFIWSIVAGWLDLIALYSLSFATGLSDALSIPAHGAIMPTLVEKKQLRVANSITTLQGIVWGMIGPVLAGFAISGLNQLVSPVWAIRKGHPGVSAAFAIDLIALLISSLCLWQVKSNWQRILPDPEHAPSGLTLNAVVFTFSVTAMLAIIVTAFGSIRELVSIIWHEANLRVAFLMVYGINLLSSAPLYVGMPMLAASRFPQGAQALGLLASALSTGSLFGTILAGLLPQPRRQMLKLFLALLGGICLGLVTLVCARSITVAMLAVLLLAAFISYVNIIGMTQIQRLTPPAQMGRMMGLLNLK